MEVENVESQSLGLAEYVAARGDGHGFSRKGRVRGHLASEVHNLMPSAGLRAPRPSDVRPDAALLGRARCVVSDSHTEE
jgi:hypothetical protein